MTNYMGVNRLKSIARHAVNTFSGKKEKLWFGDYRKYRGSEWITFSYYKKNETISVIGKVYVSGYDTCSRVDIDIDIEQTDLYSEVEEVHRYPQIRNVTYYTPDFVPIKRTNALYESNYDERYHVDSISKAQKEIVVSPNNKGGMRR